MEERDPYQELYSELEKYEHQGIGMKIDSHPASPMQIVTAHMVKEDNAYMRDYIWDESGIMKEISFHNVKYS